MRAEARMSESSGFEGRTVLITGGAAGIGHALCEAFAARGAFVYAADVNEGGLEELASQSPASRSITPIKLDVSRRDDFRDAIKRVVAEHGHIDFLLNNAGIVVAALCRDASAYWGVCADGHHCASVYTGV